MQLSSERQRFFYRVAGVVLDGSRVLAHKDNQDSFWALPGGSCEFGEDSMSALAREFREELNADVRVGRLIWVVENFFGWRGWECHEIGLYYEVALVGEARRLYALESFPGGEPTPSVDPGGPGYHLEFRWLAIEDLARLDVRPSFLTQHLASIPAETRSIIHRDVR